MQLLNNLRSVSPAKRCIRVLVYARVYRHHSTSNGSVNNGFYCPALTVGNGAAPADRPGASGCHGPVGRVYERCTAPLSSET